MGKNTKEITINNAVCNYRQKKGGTSFSIDSFKLEEGEHISLVGKSGSGKSSLLNLIAGFLSPSSGSVKVCGHEIAQMSEGRRDLVRRKHIGMVFQTYQLIDEFTVLENASMGAYFSDSGKVEQDEVRHLLGRVGLADYAQRLPRELSVGQRQRVSIVRALIKKPELVLADEPTGALDPETGEEVCDLLSDLLTETGSSLIFVTHDKSLAGRFSRSLEVSEIINWNG